MDGWGSTPILWELLGQPCERGDKPRYFFTTTCVPRNASPRVDFLNKNNMMAEATDCPTTLERQMELLAALDEGWYDESSRSYDPSELQWATTLLRSAITAFELPTPYIYPTPEGRVRAEWSTSDSEVIVTVDLRGRRAEVIASNVKSGATA